MMEETLEGGQGPPRAVAPLERDRIRFAKFCKSDLTKKEDLGGTVWHILQTRSAYEILLSKQ